MSGKKAPIKISELPNMLVKCQYCKQQVQLGVLPLHEELCKKAQSSSHSYVSTRY